MKIKTLEKFQDLIDKDMAWRKKELIDIKMLIHSTESPTLCRAGIALLSAHFEGFIKQASNYYVVFVSSQKIKLNELRTNFVAIRLKKIFSPCSDTEKISVYQNTIDNLLEKYNNFTFHIKYSPEDPIIKTESNPSSTVIKEIFQSIGLDFSPYLTKTNYIDADLLSNRHSIVHGEKINIAISDFDNTFGIIINIMEQISKQIVDAAINKNYLNIHYYN